MGKRHYKAPLESRQTRKEEKKNDKARIGNTGGTESGLCTVHLPNPLIKVHISQSTQMNMKLDIQGVESGSYS